MHWTRAFAFFQLWLNLVLRLTACCALRKVVSYRLKLLSGAWNVPFYWVNLPTT
jgi:hypothetical protein